MVHRHNHVIGTMDSSSEEGIRWPGTAHPNTFLRGLLHCWCNDCLLFIPKQSVFTGMGIQSRDSDSGAGYLKILSHGLVSKPNSCEDSFRRQGSGKFSNREVGRDEQDFERASQQHHTEVLSLGQVCE